MAGKGQSSRYPPLEVRVDTGSFATTLIELLFRLTIRLENGVHKILERCTAEAAWTSLLNVIGRTRTYCVLRDEAGGLALYTVVGSIQFELVGLVALYSTAVWAVLCSAASNAK